MHVEPSKKSFRPSRLNVTEPSEKQANFANKNITTLPNELLVKIFSNLDTRDLLNCQLVNRHWQELIDRDHILALAYYRRCHPIEQRISPLTVERYHSSIQSWLRGFSNLGRESVARLDKFLQHKHFTEILFFSIAKVLAKARALTCQNVGTIKHSYLFGQPSFSPDGNYLTVSSDRTAEIWGLFAGQWQHKATIRHSGWLRRMSFSPDGSHIVTASYDNTAKIWELEGGQWREKTTLEHSDWVMDAFFSPDGRHLVTISIIATIWELVGDQWQVKATIRHSSPVTRACFSPDGNHLVTIAFKYKTAKIWGLIADQSEKEAATKSYDVSWCSGFVEDVCFSPDGNFFVTFAVNTCRIWELVDGKWKQSAALKHSDQVEDVRFSPDGKHLVTITDFTVKIWGAVDNRWLEKATTRHCGELRSVCFSPDGSHLVTASTDSAVTIWGLVGDDWQEKITIQHFGLLAIASFSPDGKHLVLLSDPDDDTNEIWGVVDGRWQLKATIGPLGLRWCRNTSFSPDGFHLVTASDDIAKIWVLKSQENDDSC